ncbi:hypothetical protein HUT18_11710 [Streptomyces sp. NA04227]|uniref:hypothetical protein n=1 Tax=Streptomyces sp. NA04227 TaxID=2742136 RepID=UPI001592308E|nr:hypothetical protein [Streptomyces sp. NA04227]QKW06964.1 hypothetical protein HUT18_11710 [Streptomyces sp. NA04227]
MDAVIAEVLTKAGIATNWTQTNLGALTEVSHGGYSWTVNLPPGEDEVPAKARVTGRLGYGGTEHMDAEATWGQTIAIVDAFMASKCVR